MYMTREAEEG